MRLRTAQIIATCFIAFVLVVLVLCIVFLKSGALSARKKPGALEYAVANDALSLSIPTNAKHAKNPVQPTSDALNDANKCFSENCAVCHGNNGSGKTDTAKGLSPEVPDLRAAHVQGLTDGEMFYTIKNGIRFTGMPSWDLPDQQIWKLVLVIRRFAQPSVPSNPSKQLSVSRPQ